MTCHMVTRVPWNHIFCDIWMTSQFVADSCDNSVVTMVTHRHTFAGLGKSARDGSRKMSTLGPAGSH